MRAQKKKYKKERRKYLKLVELGKRRREAEILADLDDEDWADEPPKRAPSTLFLKE